MIVDDSEPLRLKRRRYTNVFLDPMEAQAAKAKLDSAKEKFGREIRIFETIAVSSTPYEGSKSEEVDEFYEFTAEDYYRVMASKKEEKFLKTKKIRDAEEAARRSKIPKAKIRTRFPDNHTLEATFHPSEKIESLFDLLKKVIVQPDSPYHLYTTPPKKRIDASLDFYSAGFVPGAIVYFAYDVPKGDDSGNSTSGPFLHEEVISLKGLELLAEQHVDPPFQPEPEPEPILPAAPAPAVREQRKPAEKKPVKPKWLKL